MPQTIGMDNDLDQALAAVGPRLRELRRQREITLAGLSAATGISVSTLSRLESGARRPTLELLSLFGTQGERARLRPAPGPSSQPEDPASES